MGSQLGKRTGLSATVDACPPSRYAPLANFTPTPASASRGIDCNEEVVILQRRLRPLDGMEAIAGDVIGQRLHVK